MASALVNMAQQIGAALGLALFTTIAVAAPGAQDVAAATDETLARGYTAAFLAGAVLLLVAAALATLAVTARQQQAAERGVGRETVVV